MICLGGMKWLILVLTTTSVQVNAGELVFSEASAPPAMRRVLEQDQVLAAVNFFEPLHPKTNRNPDWPDRLNFKSARPMSQIQMEKVLRQHWRIVYSCGGKPVSSQYLAKNQAAQGEQPNYAFEGWKRGNLEVDYTGTTYSRHLKVKPGGNENLNFDANNRNAEFRTSLTGAGKLQVDYASLFRTIVIEYQQVVETGEFVMKQTTPLICEDGTKMEAFYVPIETPMS